MEALEVIAELNKELDRLKSSDQKTIETDALRAYLSDMAASATESLQHRQLTFEGSLADHNARVLSRLEMFKAVLEAGKAALNSIIIVNGGAVVALLGVMSSLVAHPQGASLARYLALPLLQFGIGVLLGAVGFGLRYISQACFSEELSKGLSGWRKAAIAFQLSAISVGVLGYVVFGFALVNSYCGISWYYAK